VLEHACSAGDDLEMGILGPKVNGVNMPRKKHPGIRWVGYNVGPVIGEQDVKGPVAHERYRAPRLPHVRGDGPADGRANRGIRDVPDAGGSHGYIIPRTNSVLLQGKPVIGRVREHPAIVLGMELLIAPKGCFLDGRNTLLSLAVGQVTASIRAARGELREDPLK
jgi:hypothetical protein